jgi:ubiquinone biosynthesis protein UbiJ
MSEIRLLRAENDSLRRDRASTAPSANFYDEIIRLRAENERLRARVEELERKLKETTS